MRLHQIGFPKPAFKYLLFAIAGLLCGAVAAYAQITTGSMIGAARDESGSVLPGASATVSSPSLPGGSKTTTTDARGEYRIAGLPPGIYSLKIELSGFSIYDETDLRVLAAGTTERNVTLKVNTVAETITVSGEAPVVDLHRVGVTNAIPLEQLEVTSTERYGVQAYMTLLPGVTTNAYNRVWNVTVMGSNSNETTILSDGVSINNASSGGSWTLGDFDGAQELNATTLGASAEYQAAGGGVLQLISKTGTNKFHGDLSGYWSPEFLTSSPTKLPCPRCGPGVSTGFKWYKYRDMSGHIGGPIYRDKAWFYGGLIYRARYGTAPGIPVPPANERFLDSLIDMNWKGNWNISDKLQFQQSFYSEIWDTVNPALTSPDRPIETLQRSRGNIALDGNYGSQLTWTLSPRTLLVARYNITQGGGNYIGFFEDLVKPNHRDQDTGFQSGNFNARQFRPRRDEGSVKFNSYLPKGRVNNNLSWGAQISRNKNVRVDIQPGNVIYLDRSGKPDQAQFVGPDLRAAVSNAQGLWAENETTVGRFTFKYGGRFDHMTAISPDAPEFDGEFHETGNTIKGLGKMIAWNTFSPRGGVAVRLTDDGKTSLRAVAGRFYLPLFVSEFEILHPGRALTTTKRYDPATGEYSTLVSITDPRRQIRIDKNMKAPYTDQFSLGVEREVAHNFAVGVNAVYKRSGDLLGWKDIGGVYGQQTARLSDGRTITVFPLLNSPADRIFLRTNGPGAYSTYRAFIVTATKRLSNRWQMTAGYTRQRSLGRDLGSTGTVGQDPNDYINSYGGLFTRDRPNQFTFMGSYEIPRIGVQIAANLSSVTGAAVSSKANVRLPQGTRAINLDPAGDKYRTQNEQWMYMRISKFLLREGSHRIELAAEFKNLLQEQGSNDVQTTVFDAPNFMKQGLLPEPRQMRLFARWTF